MIIISKQLYALTLVYSKFQSTFSPFQILQQFHQRGSSMKYSANYCWNQVINQVIAGIENSTVADRQSTTSHTLLHSTYAHRRQVLWILMLSFILIYLCELHIPKEGLRALVNKKRRQQPKCSLQLSQITHPYFCTIIATVGYLSS